MQRNSITAAPVRSPVRRDEAADLAERYFAAARRRLSVLRVLFFALVVAPTTLAVVYYGMLASDIYVSESRFVVRGLSSQRVSGFDAIFRTFGIARDADDAYAVQTYMTSREAAVALANAVPLKEVFSRPEIDFVARFPRPWQDDTVEALFAYLGDRVTVIQDGTKGITILRVAAFRPDDAYQIAEALMSLGEGRANQINQRARLDAVDLALEEVAQSEAAVLDAQTALTVFRTRELMIDPKQTADDALDLIGGLTAQLAETETRLEEGRRLAAGGPSQAALQARASALRAQIAAQRGQLVGEDGSLSGRVAEYERLSLGRELADKRLESALTTLDRARDDARRQQIYLETVVRPNRPDEAEKPERIRSILAVLVLGLAIFCVLWVIAAGAREHAQ